MFFVIAFNNDRTPLVNSLSPSRVIRLTKAVKKLSSCTKQGQTLRKPKLGWSVEMSLRRIDRAGLTMLTSAWTVMMEIICVVRESGSNTQFYRWLVLPANKNHIKALVAVIQIQNRLHRAESVCECIACCILYHSCERRNTSSLDEF